MRSNDSWHVLAYFYSEDKSGLSSDVQDAHKDKTPLEILLPLPFWKHADSLQ